MKSMDLFWTLNRKAVSASSWERVGLELRGWGVPSFLAWAVSHQVKYSLYYSFTVWDPARLLCAPGSVALGTANKANPIYLRLRLKNVMSVAPSQVLEEGFWDYLVQKLSFMFLIGVISCPGSTVLKSKGTQEPAWETKPWLLSSLAQTFFPSTLILVRALSGKDNRKQ